MQNEANKVLSCEHSHTVVEESEHLVDETAITYTLYHQYAFIQQIV